MVQEEDPALEAYPAAQKVQLDAPSPLYVPDGQDAAVTEPAGQYVPLEQIERVVAEESEQR